MNGFSGFGNSPAKQKVDLTRTPNPTTKAVHRKVDTANEMTDTDMENKGDFNISNLHKDTKISLNKKKSEEPESYGAGHKKIMKDGPKNKVHGAGNTGNWQPHQFKK